MQQKHMAGRGRENQRKGRQKEGRQKCAPPLTPSRACIMEPASLLAFMPYWTCHMCAAQFLHPEASLTMLTMG